MASIPNPRVYFHSIPQGYPVPGQDLRYDDSPSIDVETVPLNGGFLTKNLWLSVDPYMRGRMRDEKIQSFVTAFPLGKAIANYGIGVVIRSETPLAKVGEYIYAFMGFEYYSVHSPETFKNQAHIIKNEEELPLSVYLGIAGMTGQTGFMGLKEHGRPQKGESIYVSTAAGAVGQMVCQLSKAMGLRVLASAGSDEKVEYCRTVLNVDRAFNYKTSSVAEELKAFGGIDIYWDNVGGKMLEDAIAAMNVHGRIVICGAASEYNDERAYGIKNMGRFIYWRLQMAGFVVAELLPKYSEEFYSTVPKLVKSGQLQYREEIVDGLPKTAEALLAILKGDNVGKVVVKVQDE